ncbi:MAG: phage Gp37/Gp68 family protein [Reyranellaceae bacterium]
MTAIEWTHRPGTKGETWNPIRARNRKTGTIGWHCTHASPGCVNCYAERQNTAGFRGGTRLPYKPGHEKDVEVFLDGKALLKPLRWREPRTIFVCSMTDLFGAFVPDETIDRILAVAALCPQHTFIVLTKRSKRMRAYFSGLTCDGARRFHVADAAGKLMAEGDNAHDEVANAHWPLPNLWLGVSVEDQQRADQRVPELLATPAAIHFVSAEPLLGEIDFSRWIDIDLSLLDWVIVGGESGPNARPMHPDWARAIRDQCASAGVAYFFKQWGQWLEADQLMGRIEQGPAFILKEGRRWQPHRPLNFTDAAFLANLLKHPFEHQSDGTTMLRLDKSRSGRLLDGVEHNAWPQVQP